MAASKVTIDTNLGELTEAVIAVIPLALAEAVAREARPKLKRKTGQLQASVRFRPMSGNRVGIYADTHRNPAVVRDTRKRLRAAARTGRVAQFVGAAAEAEAKKHEVRS